MLKSTIKDGSSLERKTGHMLAIDKHLIPFTGADRHNDRLVISGRPKGGTSRFETYAIMVFSRVSIRNGARIPKEDGLFPWHKLEDSLPHDRTIFSRQD